VLIEVSKVKEVPMDIDNAHAGAVWLRCEYPEIQEMIFENNPNRTGNQMLDELALKLAVHVAIEQCAYAEFDGDIRAAIRHIIRQWCIRQQEETILKVVDMLTVASGVLTQEEMDEDEFFEQLIELAEQLDDDPTVQAKIDALPLPKSLAMFTSDHTHPNENAELELHSAIAQSMDGDGCTANLYNCPICDVMDEPVIYPDPESINDVVSLLRDDNSDTAVIDAILWAENKLKAKGGEYGAKEVYAYAAGWLEQGDH